MSLSDTRLLDYLFGLQKTASNSGSIPEHLLTRLGILIPVFVIHIAGTNRKGRRGHAGPAC